MRKQKKLASELREAGKTPTQIAKLLDIPVNAVRALLGLPERASAAKATRPAPPPQEPEDPGAFARALSAANQTLRGIRWGRGVDGSALEPSPEQRDPMGGKYADGSPTWKSSLARDEAMARRGRKLPFD